MLFTGKDEASCLRRNIQCWASTRTEPFRYHPVAVFDLLQGVRTFASSVPALWGEVSRSSKGKFFVVLRGSLANPLKGCMTALPLRVGDHVHVPFLNAKMQASKGNEKGKCILPALSFVFAYMSKFRKGSTVVPWTFNPSSLLSANQFVPRCVSAAAITIIPIIASHFNGLLVSIGKSYPICNVSSQHLEKARSLCHVLRRTAVLWWHLRAFIISVQESLGHTLVS